MTLHASNTIHLAYLPITDLLIISFSGSCYDIHQKAEVFIQIGLNVDSALHTMHMSPYDVKQPFHWIKSNFLTSVWYNARYGCHPAASLSLRGCITSMN